MGDAPYTGDLDLAAVRTREDLAARLRTVHKRADRPSLRTLETKTRHLPSPLSRTVVAEMLKGTRFPHKAVMVAFLRACEVPEDTIEAWVRAWERVADGNEGPGRPQGSQSSPGTYNAADNTERQLREQVNQLAADNEKLRAQVAEITDTPPPPATPGRELLAAVNYAAPQDHLVRYFEIRDGETEQLFYSELAKFVQNATDTVFIRGKGFNNERRASLYKPLIRAEKEALRRGVEVFRIVPGNRVAASWAKGYAGLAQEFSRFHMYADLDAISYDDIIVIDPRGHYPVAAFLFETRERGGLGPAGRPVGALFLMNARSLATNLADHFIDHIDELSELRPELSAQDVADLASTYTYFAWGIHMAASEMRRQVPDAHRLGKAILYEWRQNLDAMLSGPADRRAIERTGNRKDYFPGVAYELSWGEKARMDRSEKRTYEEVAVTIEINGKARAAFIYVPLPMGTEITGRARRRWIDLVEEGAEQNNMTEFLTALREGRARTDADRI